MQMLKIYAMALASLLAIDGVWLVLVARKFYQEQIGYLMKSEVNYGAALLFYLLFVLGLIVLVIQPALVEKSWWVAVWRGGLLGLVSYATYDLTNLATIRNWSMTVTVVDLIWGVFLAAVISFITFSVASKLNW